VAAIPERGKQTRGDFAIHEGREKREGLRLAQGRRTAGRKIGKESKNWSPTAQNFFLQREKRRRAKVVIELIREKKKENNTQLSLSIRTGTRERSPRLSLTRKGRKEEILTPQRKKKPGVHGGAEFAKRSRVLALGERLYFRREKKRKNGQLAGDRLRTATLCLTGNANLCEQLEKKRKRRKEVSRTP